MTALGDTGLDVYNTFSRVNDSSTYEEVIEAFDQYCNPRHNTVYERFVFSQLVQGSANVDSFVVAMKSQAIKCEFGEAADDLVRDHLVVGIRNPVIRKELLSDPDLTLQTAVKIARAWERSETEATAMVTYVPPSLTTIEDAAVHRLETRRPSVSPCTRLFYPACSKCLYNHTPERCPAMGKECKYCKDVDHFASVCP